MNDEKRVHVFLQMSPKQRESVDALMTKQGTCCICEFPFDPTDVKRALINQPYSIKSVPSKRGQILVVALCSECYCAIANVIEKRKGKSKSLSELSRPKI